MGIVVSERRRRIALSSLAAAALFAACPAHAASTAAEGRALIVRPGTLNNTTPLSFGALSSGGTAGTVTISNTGVRTTAGGVTPLGGTVSAATFVGMTDSFPFWVDVDAPSPATITLTRVGGGATMTVSNFTVEGGVGFRLIPTNTVFQFRVGGRLNVGANQMQGTYNGTFNVTVNYF